MCLMQLLQCKIIARWRQTYSSGRQRGCKRGNMSPHALDMHLQTLRLVLYDHDTLDKDDEIGEAKLAVSDLKDQEEKDVWLDINETKPDQHGAHAVCGHLLTLGVVKSYAAAMVGNNLMPCHY